MSETKINKEIVKGKHYTVSKGMLISFNVGR